MADYELYLASSLGDRLAGPLPNLRSLEWSIALDNVGVCRAEFGLDGWDPLWCNEALRLELWRSTPGGAMRLLQVYFLQDFGQDLQTTQSGDVELVWVRGFDLNYLLTTRIVAAAAGSAGAAKNGYAAAVMAAYVDEALLTDAGRDISGEFDLQISNLATAGADIHYAASRGNLLRVVQNCAAASGAAGSPVRFWIAPRGSAAGTLYIRARPWGRDLRGERPLSAEAASLYDVAWSHLGGNSANYAYVGGQGQEGNRTVVQVSLGGMTALTRREVWLENTQMTDADALTTWGRMRLWEQRPTDSFRGTIRDTEVSRFGRDWDLGDYVRAEDRRGARWDAEVAAVAGQVTANGEQVWAALAAEAPVST